MSNKFSFADFLSSPQFTAYDNEGAGSGGEGGAGAGGDAGAGGSGGEGGAGAGGDAGAGGEGGQQTRTFTQEDVNRFLAGERRKMEAQVTKLQSQLKDMGESRQFSDEQRTELENTLEGLQNQLLTKDQIAAKEKKALQTKYQNELQEATDRAIAAEQRYESSTLARALMDAAVDGEAFNPSQVVTLLQSNTKLTKNEDGQEVVMVSFPDTHVETGEPIVTTLTPTQAIARMKELDNIYGNLFKTNVVTGVGGSSTGSDGKLPNGQLDVRNMTMEQYKEARAKNPSSVGL